MNPGKWIAPAVAAYLIGAGSVGAQTSPAAPAVPSRPVNGYLDAGMNPYLNPYMTNQNVSADAAVLYFLAAQRASGGIGSGALSGVRQLESGTSRSPVAPRGAGPFAGEGASRYFQRGTSRLGAPGTGYFQRLNGRNDR